MHVIPSHTLTPKDPVQAFLTFLFWIKIRQNVNYKQYVARQIVSQIFLKSCFVLTSVRCGEAASFVCFLTLEVSWFQHQQQGLFNLLLIFLTHEHIENGVPTAVHHKRSAIAALAKNTNETLSNHLFLNNIEKHAMEASIQKKVRITAMTQKALYMQ